MLQVMRMNQLKPSATEEETNEETRSTGQKDEDVSTESEVS